MINNNNNNINNISLNFIWFKFNDIHSINSNIYFSRVFDQDNNGYITRDELKKAMEILCEDVTEAQVSEMLALADLDKDGRIDYEGKDLTVTFVKLIYNISLFFLPFFVI